MTPGRRIAMERNLSGDERGRGVRPAREASGQARLDGAFSSPAGPRLARLGRRRLRAQPELIDENWPRKLAQECPPPSPRRAVRAAAVRQFRTMQLYEQLVARTHKAATRLDADTVERGMSLQFDTSIADKEHPDIARATPPGGTRTSARTAWHRRATPAD